MVSSRRRLFQMGAIGVVAAAGAAAVDAATTAAPAGAATGGNMIIGTLNLASAQTDVTELLGGPFAVLNNSSSDQAIAGVNLGGPGITGGGTSGHYGVQGTSDTGIGVVASVSTGGIGVQGSAPISSTQTSLGVQGKGVTGVQGDSSAAGTTGIAGVQGIGSGAGNPGLYAANSSGAQLYLQPMSSNTLPPANTGSLVVLANGQLNYCYAPSAWVPLTNGIVPITPIRVVNTATSAGGITGPLVPGATVHTTIDLRTGPIPLEAIGIVGNFAISGVGGAVLNGFGVATIYPAGAATPATANINAGAGCFAISNSVSVGFGTGGNAGKLSIVWNGGGAVPNAEAYLDITGYIL